MRPPTLIHWLLAAVLAITIGGCGLHNPYQTAARPTSTTTTSTNTTGAPADQRDPAGERGGTIPPSAQAAQRKLAAGAALRTPEAALGRYTRAYLDWDAARAVEVQRELAAISLGQARAQALQAAASAARDPKLTASHIANHGQLVAISHGQGPAATDWVIVTSEQTTGQGDYQGLPPTLHIIYAQLTHISKGWVVSGWQPQN
jgi:hypothetical protein